MKSSITIFVSGSKSLKVQRTRLKALANNINAENRLKGKKISLNMFSYQNLGDNQSEYDDFIKNQSDVIFFLIEDHIGDKTRDELILASQSFKKTGTPRMYIFLKEFNERTPEIEEAERLINEYCDTYYIEYSNLDDLETKVKERLLQEIDKIEMSSGVSPKMKIKKLRVGLIVSLVTVLLLMSVMAWQFLSKKDDVTLLFIGGGSALNCLLEKDGVRNGDLYEQSITLPIPTKASWPIVSNEYVYQHAVRNDSKKKLYYPISLSAMEAYEEDFLKMASKEQFVNKCSILGLHLGDDALTVYIKKTYSHRLIDGKDKLSTQELASFIQEIANKDFMIYTTDEGSGTYTYYKKYLEPYGVDLSKKYLGKHQERFTDMTPKSKIRKDETPYIMLGSRYYVAKEVYDEGDCRPLSIVDEDGNAISKPIYLYFAGYNTDGGEAFWIPKEMKELLIQINPKFNDVIKDNKLPRDNETVIVVLNQYLKD